MCLKYFSLQKALLAKPTTLPTTSIDLTSSNVRNFKVILPPQPQIAAQSRHKIAVPTRPEGFPPLAKKSILSITKTELSYQAKAISSDDTVPQHRSKDGSSSAITKMPTHPDEPALASGQSANNFLPVTDAKPLQTSVQGELFLSVLEVC